MHNLTINLTFSSENNRYFAGQMVRGSIEIDNYRRKIINKLCLNYKGLTSVKFVKNGKLYSEQKIHFKTNAVIVGDRVGRSRTVLSAGCMSLPFSFKLPENAPSTSQGSYGFTKYTIQAKLFTR